MPQAIHAKNTEAGLRFRVWSSITDSYWTEEMTETELREYTTQEAGSDATEHHLRVIDADIERAISSGSSSPSLDKRSLDDPWREDGDDGDA